MISLSIVIVHYRAWDYLTRCLDGLLAPEFRFDEWEIIVVDNDSDDGRLEELAGGYGRARFLLSHGNYGFAHGCNRGAEASRGERLLFMNPDVIARPSDIAELLEAGRLHPDLSILSARQVDERGRPQKVFDTFPDRFLYLKTLKSISRALMPARFPITREVRDTTLVCDWVSGSLVLIEAADLAALGGWSEDYWMYSEDADLCLRARERGLLTGVSLATTVMHAHGGSSGSSPRTKVITKSETTISKHVYVSRNLPLARRAVLHAIVAGRALFLMGSAVLVNAITLGSIRYFRTCSSVFLQLVSYYAGVARSRTWFSPRSIRRAKDPETGPEVEVVRGTTRRARIARR